MDAPVQAARRSRDLAEREALVKEGLGYDYIDAGAAISLNATLALESREGGGSKHAWR